MGNMAEQAGAALQRPEVRLEDSLWAESGTIFLTGTQALLRLMLMQRQRDVAAGIDSRGFLSGYRGSPLGMLDQAAWKAGQRFSDAGLRFLPAINEELAATAVLGTQRVQADPARACEGVFAMWYGKGPGVDRAGDAIHHGNAYGASPAGGVLVVAGDDHGCVSSSMPHQSELVFQAWQLPVVAPGSVAEMLEFGLYGWARSRFSGNWVGFTALSEVVESACTVDLDHVRACAAAWQDAQAVHQRTGYRPPPGGLHYRWPDLPSVSIEERLLAKQEAVRAFARVNAIDRHIVLPARPRVGIITVGKAHFDFMEVLRRLQLPLECLASHGVAVYKPGLTWPLEPTRVQAFAAGLEEVLVLEEKAPLVENQLRSLLYHLALRPRIIGKQDADGKPLVPTAGELRPSRLIGIIAHWLLRHCPDLDRRSLVRDFTLPELLSNEADSVRRQPYFCAGCPHNTSTRVPTGSRAQAGIGCHFMASWMERDTEGLIQMGGEGGDWVAHAMFTQVPHIFQNLGDGTYYHSGYLAIRQAVAAGARMTYKILYNDAVAMTGGQPVDGRISVDAIARQVEAEGVREVAVVSDDIGKYHALRHRFPRGTHFHAREELDAVQRRLRDADGVSVLIYEQTCAAEKRRRRKKGLLQDPELRLFINERVCEGCGDCAAKSNCVAVLPVPGEQGNKRRIDQGSCNKDYSCVQGFCPSFVGVTGAPLKKRLGALGGAADACRRRAQALPLPPRHAWDGPWDLLVAGVGGTGVVTIGAVVAMAAHLEGKQASVLDFMGFAQKGGAVLSHVRLAAAPGVLQQVRIDTQQADALLACDLVVAASAEALASVRRGRSRIVANIHEVPVASSVRDPDAQLHAPALLEKLRFAAGQERVHTLDAQSLADASLGDAIYSNMLQLGHAWQLGLVPVSELALMRAIELNGVAVEQNKLAFTLGRLAAHDMQALTTMISPPAMPTPPKTLEGWLNHGRAHLSAWQDERCARQWEAFILQVAEREAAQGGDASLPFTCAVAASLLKLTAIKDEYEVARLYTDGVFRQALAMQFEGRPRLSFYMAPPLLARAGPDGRPRKLRLGPWMLPVLRLLAWGRRLRGTPLDLFSLGAERRMERALAAQYRERVLELLPQLTPDRMELLLAIARLPLSMRGYGHVKLANVAAARAREAELLHRLDPARYPPPPRGAAGQLRGIAVVAAPPQAARVRS